jgi:two-component system, NtrC family, sensor histidine kinase HydH
MEIALRAKEKGTLFLAAAALAIIGLSLVFSTWQSLNRQRDAVERHMLLTARAVLTSVESSLRHSMGMSGMHGRGMFRSDLDSYLRGLVESKDVYFVGLFGDRGGRVLTSRDNADPEALVLPSETFRELAEKGEWSGTVPMNRLPVFVYARQAQLGGFGLLPRSRGGIGGNILPQRPVKYLVVGLDTSAHMAVYGNFRRNALFQAAFILGAAVCIWVLILAVLRRRLMAGRAISLERVHSALLDNLPDGLMTLGPDGTVLAANPAARAILGVEDGELVGRKCTRIPGEVLAPLEGANPVSSWKELDLGGRSLEILTLPIKDAHEAENRLVIIRDRTEHKHLEDRLQEAKKLAAVGTLAAGVAHEIRNPLSALRGFAQYFAKQFSGREPEETYARTMVTEADRLDRVITDLLFLSNPRPLNVRRIPLASLVEEVSRVLTLDLERKGVRLETRLHAGEAMADDDALKQVLLNLVLNSLDALKGSEAGQGLITVVSVMEADGVRLEISDNGAGMGPEEKAKAFEPFFTGKASGTGLGLAIVHKIMRDHGGSADIDSVPGQGTTVRLVFPERSAENGGRG